MSNDLYGQINSDGYGMQELITNPTSRVPVCLCLDTSASMRGAPITELNRGVRQFIEELQEDEVAIYAAEVCIVTFGGKAQCIQEFSSLEAQSAPTFPAEGGTPMGEALSLALDKLEKRKQQYKDAGVDYYQPWLVIMSDGHPNGDTVLLRQAAQKAAALQTASKLSIFPIAIGDKVNMDILKRISPQQQPLKLAGLKFTEFFQWLSQSVSRVSQSMPGERVLIDFEGIKDWSEL